MRRMRRPRIKNNVHPTGRSGGRRRAAMVPWCGGWVGLWRPALVVMLACPWYAMAVSAQAETIDRVVATVNNEIVTASELDESVEFLMLKAGQPDASRLSAQERLTLQRRVLEELINKKLVEEFAAKSGIQASDEEVDRAVQDVMVRNNLTRERLEAALRQDGLTFEEYRAQIREQIVKAKLINREVRPNIGVSDDAVREYYLNHPEQFKTEQGVVLRHIMFRLPKHPGDKTIQDTLKKARSVRQEYLDGRPFEELARRYSQDEATAGQGGMLGFFRREDLIPEFREAVERLSESEVSEPIRTPTGIHLVKVEERTTGALRPFEKVKDEIRSRLYEEQGERFFQDWIKELRKNAFIEILL